MLNMNSSLSFGNLTLITRNEVKTTRCLYDQLKKDSRLKGLNGEIYKGEACLIDNRIFSKRNSDDIFEIKIAPINNEKEQEILLYLHNWAIQNKVDTRIDIDIRNNSTRREQLLDCSQAYD